MLARVGELSMAVERIAAAAGPKGKAPLRPCPDDFDIIFVEQGRFACMAWYRARRETVTRWLTERGKDRLIALRAAFVASQRAAGRWMTRQTCLVETRVVKKQPVRAALRDRRKVSPSLARHAAQYLRTVRHGGWIVSMASNGDWRVGTRLLSAAQLVEFATAKGFDPQGHAEEHTPASPKLRGPDGVKVSEIRKRYDHDHRELLKYESSNVERRLGANWRAGDL